MREIKFRGRSENGTWYIGDFVSDISEFNRTCDKAYILPYWDKLNIPIQVIKETVGQYTGLKDKNGKEIYKRDIVSYFGNKYEVLFRNGAFGWMEDGEFYSFNEMAPSVFDELEVIGNVYENPELLEDEKRI